MSKTQLVYLIILFLFTSFSGFSQNSLSDEEQKLLVEQDLLETALEYKNKGPINSSSTGPALSSVLLSDLDDDGMDDSWETSNGLDPTNPKDAWEDADNDMTLNLFEFQLETDPNAGGSPVVYEFRPSDGEAALSDLINSAENDIRVVRLAQGFYYADVVAMFEENFRIMIQGGWNNDFTEYDPALYPTNWVGLNDEALNIFIPVDNQIVTKSTVILEGVTFRALETFSLSGPAQISIYSGNSAISIYNCNMNNNPYYGLALFHKKNATLSEVFIVNSVIGNNTSGGISTQVTDTTNTRWRLFNTTINNPQSEEGGIDGLTLYQGQLKIELTNCINWGNTNYSLNFSALADVQVTTINSCVDQAEPSLDITDLSNSINMDPLFQNVMADDWTLSLESPCIDAGIDVGLSFNGSAPDMGALETGVSSNINKSTFVKDINVFPNPFSDVISLEIDGAGGQEVEVNIYDMIGNSLYAEKRIISSMLEIETSQISKGLLILSLKINHKQYSTKILKN